jgi:hypothetical protein
MGSEGRKITILHQLLDIKKDMKGISQTVYNFDFKRIKGKCYPSEVSITVGSGARTSPDSNLGVSLKTTYNTEVCRTIKDFLDENPEIETSVNPNKLKELLRAVDNTSRLLRIDKEVFNKVHENLEDRDILVKAARGELRSCMSNHLEETINDNYLWSQKGPGTSAGDLPSAVEE